MVRNIVVLGGNSHPQLVDNICTILGIPVCNRILGKFSVGESRCEIQDSVRGKDVYIVQTSGGEVNDHLIDLCVMISACKIGSARRVTAVLPLFPYSRQPDAPYNNKVGPAGGAIGPAGPGINGSATAPGTPSAATGPTGPLPGTTSTAASGVASPVPGPTPTRVPLRPAEPSTPAAKSPTNGLVNGVANGTPNGGAAVNGKLSSAIITSPHPPAMSSPSTDLTARRSSHYTTHNYENPGILNAFEAKPGFKQWVAQAGTLIADLLTCSGADHVITMDLHDPQYQGYFDIPVDNLYSKAQLTDYIQKRIPKYQQAIIVSPDAGGAKRATEIADHLDMDFALIHKEGRPTKITDRQSSTMMLVGDVAGRVCILIDDMVDTANTVTRAAKLLKREGATTVYALITHGVLGDDAAIARVNASCIDRIVVTNSVAQDARQAACPRLEVLDVAPVFAEAIRRVHHGESMSTLFELK